MYICTAAYFLLWIVVYCFFFQLNAMLTVRDKNVHAVGYVTYQTYLTSWCVVSHELMKRSYVIRQLIGNLHLINLEVHLWLVPFLGAVPFRYTRNGIKYMMRHYIAHCQRKNRDLTSIVIKRSSQLTLTGELSGVFVRIMENCDGVSTYLREWTRYSFKFNFLSQISTCAYFP